jgi:hypothetical protein
MYLAAAPITGTGIKPVKLTNQQQAQAAQLAKKRGIEVYIPYIVAASGILTIITLTIALRDKQKKRGKK